MKNFDSKIDLHMHSIASDGLSDSKIIVSKAKKLGFAISITDHNTISQSLIASNNNLEVTVIPGIEATCKEGPHILFYFYSPNDLKNFYISYIKPYYTKFITSNLKIGAMDLIEGSKKYNGISVAAHPFSPGLCGSYDSFCKNSEFIKNMIAIEGINSTMTNKVNDKAINWAKENNKPIIAGSDAHNTNYIGIAYTKLESIETVDIIINSIKKGNCSYDGRTMKNHEKILDSKNKIKLWLNSPAYFLSKGIKDTIKSRKLRRLNKC